MNASLSELPVDRQPEGAPPLGLHVFELPRVKHGGEGFETVAQRWRVVAQIDPSAATPRLAADGHEIDVVGFEVRFAERR